MKKNQEAIDRAIETFDHVLWGCIAKACAYAYSKAFEKKINEVRVVYQTSSDPREPKRFKQIKSYIEKYVKWALPIIKEMRPIERAGLMKFYLDYAIQQNLKSSIEVVVIGPDHFYQIVCPCNGQHLENTGDLKKFNVVLQKPKKVGKNIYEFRFSIT